MSTSFSVGDHVLLVQPFNAICGTIESISEHTDGTLWAMCRDVHDVYGPCKRAVNFALATAKPLPFAPRALTLPEARAL